MKYYAAKKLNNNEIIDDSDKIVDDNDNDDKIIDDNGNDNKIIDDSDNDNDNKIIDDSDNDNDFYYILNNHKIFKCVLISINQK